MAIKKNELYSSLWASCDELRGGMDASQYKDYVLTFLFLKYVSDKFRHDRRAKIVYPEGCTFPDIVKLKGDKEVGEKLNMVLDGIGKENELPWLANKDNDFNDEERLGKGKEMVDRLSKLIGIFEGLEFGGNSGLMTFDFAVANPPFSYKAWSNGVIRDDSGADIYRRFEYGEPPEKNGDYAFLLHILKSLKSSGKAAVILPHGVLFRGNAEADIRRNLIKQGYIKGIIGLPANLFYGTGIPACIIVIDKAGAKARLKDKKSGIFMIDAGKGFMKDGPKNRLRSQDIHKIVDVFNNRITQQGYSRMVRFSEIEANDYNLNIPRYIDSAAAEDRHDLGAHLKGGIPNADIEALDNYWQVFPQLRHSLFKHKRKGYSKALIPAAQVKAAILEHQEFKTFAKKSLARFNRWKNKVGLQEIVQGDHPKTIIHIISEAQLEAFATAPLLDSASQALEAYIEEHAVEGGLLEEALTDSGKVNKGSVTARLKQLSVIPAQAGIQEEFAALKQVKKLIDTEATQKKQLKTAQEALDKQVFKRYPKLTVADNKALIVEDKWLATLQSNIVTEIERVTQQLANRVKTLEERYETPLPELTEEVAVLSAKVDEHLRKMGLRW